MSSPCCNSLEHVTNFQDPDFLSTIISDLTKLKFQLRKKLQPAVVLDGIELVCGTGCGRDKVEQTLRAGWALDPVHPTSHVYAKMALNLIEKVASLRRLPTRVVRQRTGKGKEARTPDPDPARTARPPRSPPAQTASPTEPPSLTGTREATSTAHTVRATRGILLPHPLTRTGEEPAPLLAEAREDTTDQGIETAGEARDPEADGTLEASAAISGTVGGTGGGPGRGGRHRHLPAIDQDQRSKQYFAAVNFSLM